MTLEQLKSLAGNVRKSDPIDTRFELARALELALEVADAAELYRDKVDETGGKSLARFEDESLNLGAKLAALRAAYPRKA